MPGAVWERISLSEMRIRAGAAAELREAARGFLPGMPGASSQYRAVHGQGSGRAYI